MFQLQTYKNDDLLRRMFQLVASLCCF